MLRFNQAPSNWEELMLWRAFLGSYDGDKWQFVNMWIKKHGNPYIVPEEETEEDYARRMILQSAVTFCIRNN